MPCSGKQLLLAKPKEDPSNNLMASRMASLNPDLLCSSNLDSLWLEILLLLLVVLVNIPQVKCLKVLDLKVRCRLVPDLPALLHKVCLLARDHLVHPHRQAQAQEPVLEIYLVTH
jgi:hypothetical protein